MKWYRVDIDLDIKQFIYITRFIMFVISSIILLTAMIGGIVLTMHKFT
jgi:NADH:ubiquinone oxidoreductase subunit 6 (subunit J)